MSASFDLTLDTLAPSITWGAVGGATAGELLEVLYTSDEPLALAKLWLPDGRKLDMTIEADRLSVLLPADTPNGVSWIHASDDVLNQAPRQAVNIAGTIIVPPPEPPEIPGPPQRSRPSIHPDRVETPRRVVRSRSRGAGHAREATRRGPLRTRSRSALRESHFANRVFTRPSRSVGEGRSVARSSATQICVARGVGSSSAVVHRRDGPGEEEAMFLLDFL